MDPQLRRWVVPFAVVGAVVVAIALTMVLGSGSSPDDPGYDDVQLQQVDAERYCAAEVEARLKSPATAEFSDAAVSGLGPFTVVGTVDAQNELGALLRSSYRCEVRLAGGSWVLEDLAIDEG